METEGSTRYPWTYYEDQFQLAFHQAYENKARDWINQQVVQFIPNRTVGACRIRLKDVRIDEYDNPYWDEATHERIRKLISGWTKEEGEELRI